MHDYSSNIQVAASLFSDSASGSSGSSGGGGGSGGTQPAMLRFSATFFSIFQNQEAVPTNGLIHSYYFIVSYKDAPAVFFLQDNPLLAQSHYKFVVADRNNDRASTIATIFLLFFTFFVLVTYTYILVEKQCLNWLQEQTWVVAYLVALLFYQNPFYISAEFQASEGGAFSAFFFSNLSQCSFLVIWLLFADAINGQVLSWQSFYLPKFAFGAVIFIASLIILFFQFPSFFSTTRKSVEAVYNWDATEQKFFVASSLSFLILFWLWALVWFFTLFMANRKLKVLPYLSTRYLQLSFRFFTVQATLVTVYYVLEYAATGYFIGKSEPFQQTTTSLTDGINTLFRQQTQLFGKVLFLSIYATTLAFLFLPASFMEDKFSTSLAATYVVSEKELKQCVKRRKKRIRKLDKVFLNVKPEVFCVDLALSLLEVSYEAYSETLGVVHEGEENLKRHGYTLVQVINNEERDLLCLVCRHEESKRLVLAFRGTRSSKNMSDNLNYAQKNVDFHSLGIPESLKTDGQFVGLDLSDTFDGTALLERKSDQSLDDDVESNWPEVAKTESQDGNLSNIFSRMKSSVGKTTTNALHAGGGLIVSAASITPGFTQFVTTSVHSGFWEAYLSVREQVHRWVISELMANPASLCITGHSLGGALATIACLDISIHLIPRLNYYHWQQMSPPISPLVAAGEAARGRGGGGGNDSPFSTGSSSPLVVKKMIKATMINFGSPRCGNRGFASFFNKLCPDAFRVVVDGDIVTGVPKSGFKHAAVEILIDSNSAGTIIIDPSFVERWLRTATKASISVHLMGNYRTSLNGVRNATLYLREHDYGGDNGGGVGGGGGGGGSVGGGIMHTGNPEVNLVKLSILASQTPRGASAPPLPSVVVSVQEETKEPPVTEFESINPMLSLSPLFKTSKRRNSAFTLTAFPTSPILSESSSFNSTLSDAQPQPPPSSSTDSPPVSSGWMSEFFDASSPSTSLDTHTSSLLETGSNNDLVAAHDLIVGIARSSIAEETSRTSLSSPSKALSHVHNFFANLA